MNKFNCYACGETYRREPFQTEEQARALGASDEQVRLWPLGLNDEGEEWVRCPKGHYGGWRKIAGTAPA